MATTVPARHVQFWREFFALYESLPVLWDARHVHYKYRDFKYDAYNKLVEKLRELEPEADLHYVLRRINIFRTNYRRERARVLSNTNAGKDYKSTLWYYNMLSFLQTQETARKQKRRGGGGQATKHDWAVRPPTSAALEAYDTTQQSFDNFSLHGDEEFKEDLYEAQSGDNRNYHDMDADTHVSKEEENEFMLLSPKVEISESDVQQQEPLPMPPQPHSTSPLPVEMTPPTAAPPPMFNSSLQALERNLAALSNPSNNSSTSSSNSNNNNNEQAKVMPIKFDAQSTFSSPPPPTHSAAIHVAAGTSSNRSDEEAPTLSASAQILARSWALQYDEMSPEQKIYARKAIADILFDGCLGRLGAKVTSPNSRH